MATLIIGSTSNNRPYGVLTVNETGISETNNTSTVSISLVLKRPSNVTSKEKKSAQCTINGVKYNWSGSISGKGDKTLISKTQTISHNADGTKKIEISASINLDITWYGSKITTISGSTSMNLTPIPIYAELNQSVVAKTETTIQMKWSADATIDKLWYSINDGDSWNSVEIAESKKGTYTINRLSSDHTYYVKTRVRRRDNLLETITPSVEVQTYPFPYANSTPDFTIGSKLTIGIFNPLKRNVTVQLIGHDDSIVATTTTDGTSIVGYNSDSVINLLYSTIPTAQSGIYKVKVAYGSAHTTIAGGLYKVNPNECAPSISAVSYQDTNSSIVAITGDNQDIVRNKSIVQYTATGISAKKSATVSSVSVQVCGNTYPLAISGTSATGGNATINSGADIEAVFEITDSRGIKSTKNVIITMLDWFTPSALVSCKRQGNYASNTDIKADCNYASLNGQNTITITYSAKKEGESSPSVTGSLTNNVTTTISLSRSYAWDVAVTVTDILGGTSTCQVFLSKGTPIVFLDKDKNSVGINCFPKDDNSIEVGGVNLTKQIMSRTLSDNMTTLTTGTYTKIPINTDISVGSKLTKTNDGGIKIGANVSSILISGMMSILSNSNGTKNVKIIKNSNTYAVGHATGYVASGNSETLTIHPVLVSVQENDIIYLTYLTSNSTDTILGNSSTARTSLTVEVVA